jgi:hypothetical protein
MAVPIAFVIGLILGYRAYETRWPWLLAAVAVAIEIVVNGVRFGFDTVVIWGLVVSTLTFVGAIAGLRLGTWARARGVARTKV